MLLTANSGVDFDDDNLPFHEENKSNIKVLQLPHPHEPLSRDLQKENEEFYHTLTSHLNHGIVGNCDFALQEIARPDVRQVKSTMMPTILRLGDTQTRSEEAIELVVKTSKCTALARPKGWKRFARRKRTAEEEAEAAKMDIDEDNATFVQLHMRSEYYLDEDKNAAKDGTAGHEDGAADNADDDGPDDDEARKRARDEADKRLIKIEKEELVRGYKYGASFAPAPEGGFPKLKTQKGMDICGFFSRKNFRRELSMGEVYYVWADPENPMSQVALSSIVQAMYEKGVMAIARWVSRDNMDPKMGVLYPSVFDEVDCFLWVQVSSWYSVAGLSRDR